MNTEIDIQIELPQPEKSFLHLTKDLKSRLTKIVILCGLTLASIVFASCSPAASTEPINETTATTVPTESASLDATPTSVLVETDPSVNWLTETFQQNNAYLAAFSPDGTRGIFSNGNQAWELNGQDRSEKFVGSDSRVTAVTVGLEDGKVLPNDFIVQCLGNVCDPEATEYALANNERYFLLLGDLYKQKWYESAQYLFIDEPKNIVNLQSSTSGAWLSYETESAYGVHAYNTRTGSLAVKDKFYHAIWMNSHPNMILAADNRADGNWLTAWNPETDVQTPICNSPTMINSIGYYQNTSYYISARTLFSCDSNGDVRQLREVDPRDTIEGFYFDGYNYFMILNDGQKLQALDLASLTGK